jgi:hypothetical protein
MDKSREIRFKQSNNLRDSFGNQIKNKADWLLFELWRQTESWSERYKRMDLRIHMHVRGELEAFCAIFQYVEDAQNIDRMIDFTPPTNRPRASSNACDMYNPMLVHIVNLFKPKEGAISSTPFGQVNGWEQYTTDAIVWLQPLNECLMFRSEQSNCISPPLRFEISPINVYRELKPFVHCNCFRFISTIQKSKLIDKIVEGTPEIMSNLTNETTPLKRGFKREWDAIYLKAIDILSRYRIMFCPDDTMFGFFEEGSLHRSESIDFSLCSSELELHAIQRMHMLYYHHGGESEKDTKDSKRTRDSYTNTRRVRTESKEGNKPRQITTSQPEEVTPQTSPDHHHGDYNAKNTHLGSPEDV